jgi:hypothetical protein
MERSFKRAKVIKPFSLQFTRVNNKLDRLCADKFLKTAPNMLE